jgi:DNA-binding NtrC family response regulator
MVARRRDGHPFARQAAAGLTDVVIVNEDDVSRTRIERALRGYRVVTALDRVDGLTLARRCHSAIVVADERQTGVSGSDLIETIRYEWPATEGVLLTETNDGVGEGIAHDRHVYAMSTRAAVRQLRALITGLIGVPRGNRR